MSSKKNQITIDLTPKTVALLTQIAEKRNLSLSRVVEKIVAECEEDLLLSTLADERDQEPLETVPDDKVW